MIKQNKRSLKSSLKKTSKISTSVKNTKFEKSYIATKKFANVKKMIINYLTNADSNAKKAEQLKFQSNESKQKAVADLYIYSTTIVTKEDLKSEISNIIKNIFAEITNKNILRFQQKLIKELKRCNAYDFARIIKVAISYFTQHREILYIFVDEFQDTSQTRFNFIKALVGKANYLFAVGDEDQQILEWSGVKNNNVEKLKNLYPKEFTEYKLEESYRLTPQIAQISNTLLNLLPDRKPKNLRGCNNNHGIVKIKKFTNIKTETNWCVKYIKKLIKKGTPPQNIGVLSRKSNMLDDEIKKTKVHCSTIHKAKGIEFDYIILLGLEEGTFSYSNNNIEEEIRLLNVAITRSKGNLIITYIQDGYRNNMYVKKSRFLNYIKESLL